MNEGRRVGAADCVRLYRYVPLARSNTRDVSSTTRFLPPIFV